MSLVNRVLFLILISQEGFSISKGTVMNNLIKNIELRTQYNFENEEYNNTLRFKLGSLKVSAKNKILTLNENEERSQFLYIKAEKRISQIHSWNKIQVSKEWRADLINAYDAYKEYLKSNPAAIRISIDIDVNEVLFWSENLTNLEVKDSLKNVLTKDIDKKAILKSLKERGFKKLLWIKDIYKADNTLIKFLELGVKGSYKNSSKNDSVARLGLTLPLGFVGEKIESRNKMIVDQYRIKREQVQREWELNKAYEEFIFKKEMYQRVESNFVSKLKIKKITSSTSISVEEKIKIYLDAIKASYKLMELKAEAAVLYNKVMLLDMNIDKNKFIGLE